MFDSGRYFRDIRTLKLGGINGYASFQEMCLHWNIQLAGSALIAFARATALGTINLLFLAAEELKLTLAL